MPERRYRMVKQHPRPGPAHDNLDTFLHLPPIAMQRTVLTGRLVGPEPASIEPQTGILQHLAACRTQLRMPLLFPTIQPDHLLDDPLFPIDTTLHSTLFLFSNPPPASVRCRFAAGRSGGFSGAPSCGVSGKPLQRYLFTGKKPSAAPHLRHHSPSLAFQIPGRSRLHATGRPGRASAPADAVPTGSGCQRPSRSCCLRRQRCCGVMSR